MSNPSDTNTKSSSINTEAGKLESTELEPTTFEEDGEAILSAQGDGSTILFKEKSEAPSSEVVEFQDAASSMKDMSLEGVHDGAMFIKEESEGDIEESLGKRRSFRHNGGRSQFQNGRKGFASDVLIEHILEKAHRAHPALHEQLRGAIILALNDGHERYLIDWSSEQIAVSKTKEESAACMISIQERDLELIAQGHLNPQIAMLSDKIHVQGNSSFAMYFFNLIAPADA